MTPQQVATASVALLILLTQPLFGLRTSWTTYQLTVPSSLTQNNEAISDHSLVTYITGEVSSGKGRLISHSGQGPRKNEFTVNSTRHRAVETDGHDHTLQVNSARTNVLVSLRSQQTKATVWDVYRPIPDTCLGSEYTSPPLELSGSIGFLTIKGGDKPTSVYVAVEGNTNGVQGSALRVDGDLLKPGDSFVMKLMPHSSKTLFTEDSRPGQWMPMISLVSSRPVVTVIGTIPGPNTQHRAASMEVLPPAQMLGTEYIITSPLLGVGVNRREANVKIMGIYDDTILTVEIFAKDGTAQSATLYERIDLKRGQFVHRPLKSDSTVLVLANKAIQVIQLISEEYMPYESLAAVPAVRMWANKYIVQALPDDFTTRVNSWATIVAETSSIEDILVISQSDFTDVSSDLEWINIGDSGLSTTSIRLDQKSVFHIYHLDEKQTFQVMLTGINLIGQGSFSTTAGRPPGCANNGLENGQRLARLQSRTRKKRSVSSTTTTPSSIFESSTVTDVTSTMASLIAVTSNVTNNSSGISNVTTIAPSPNTTVAVNTTAAATTTPVAANTTAEPASEALSTGAIAGTAAAVGAAVTGAVVAAVAINATGATVAATGATAAGAAGAAAAGNAAAAAGTAAAGNAAAAAGNAAATGATVATTHGGSTAMAAANPGLVAVV